MLTIIGPSDRGSWHEVKCLCDCGNIVVLSYPEAYRGKFSCGCAGRRNGVNYAGVKVFSPSGNERNGRTLLVLERDPVDRCWRYLCSCCNQVFKVHRGLDTGIVRTLKEYAAGNCENYKRFYPVSEIGGDQVMVLHNYIEANGGAMGRNPSYLSLINDLARRYDEKDIVRSNDGKKILGFRGMPRVLQEDLDRAAAREQRAADAERVREREQSLDPDGFGAMLSDVEPSDVEPTNG